MMPVEVKTAVEMLVANMYSGSSSSFSRYVSALMDHGSPIDTVQHT